MQEFILPVKINGKEINFNARLLRMGYIYKMEVDIDEVTVQFERDEEGEWRALVTQDDLSKNRNIKKETLHAIAEYIDYISK